VEPLIVEIRIMGRENCRYVGEGLPRANASMDTVYSWVRGRKSRDDVVYEP
jgi:hypothetical protein